MKWKKVEAGRYKSEDGRFSARSKWDRCYGNHWVLYDKNDPTYEKQGIFIGSTLAKCKDYAERVKRHENSAGAEG